MTDGKRNILYMLASDTWGGGEEYVYRIVEALRGRYGCFTVTMSAGNTRKMSAVADKDHLFNFRPGSLADIVSAIRIARITNRNSIGIIHVNKFSHAFIAVWARFLSHSKPRIVMTRHLIKKAKTGKLYNWLYGQLDCIVFVSEIAMRTFMGSNPRISQDRVRMVHNGVPDMPQDPSLRDGNGIPVIAFAGRLVPDKGVEVLIDALAELRHYNYKARLIGTGNKEYVAGLRNHVNRKGLGERILFAGFTDDVNDALQNVHIGVAPSVIPESFGLVIAEYMRSGLAVITSDNGAQPEFLTDGKDALLIKPSDHKALAGALESLLADPGKCAAMGAAARRAFLDRLTYDRFLKKMTAIYDRLS